MKNCINCMVDHTQCKTAKHIAAVLPEQTRTHNLFTCDWHIESDAPDLLSVGDFVSLMKQIKGLP